MNNNINEIIYICEFPECNYSSTIKRNLYRHKLIHEKNIEYKCDYINCSYKTTTKMNLDKHKIIHNNTIFKCEYPECKYETTIKYYLVNHKNIHLTEKNFNCDYIDCSSKFKTLKELNYHKKQHDTSIEYKCEYMNCNYKTNVKHYLNNHTKIHSLIYFKCEYPECLYKTNVKGDLNKHILTHTQERNFICTEPNCKATFKTQKTLTEHIKIHDDSNKKYKCTFDNCNAKFLNKCNLDTHIYTHTGEKPYKCPNKDCNKSFSQNSSLNRHIRMHENIKPYKCKFCEQAFCDSGSLLKHERIHKNIKPFICNECDFKTAQPGCLKKHIDCWHTKEGMNKHKKQEQRLRTILKKNYEIDEEIVIKYRDGCVYDPDKYCARIDFQITGIIPVCVIVECDENQHESYELSCELSRMTQIHESVLKAGESRPLLFIRYNPNGKFYNNDKEIKMTRIQREQKLIELLKQIETEEITFTEPLNIIYVCYDINEDGYPKITDDSDYVEEMKACIRII